MTKRVSLLRDDPLFGSESFAKDSDAFNHEAYAQVLLKILTEAKPPLSVGLFGPWGIGKSTIINILFSLIKDNPAANLKSVYFNAWKYSGDSFRRQFLIEVAKAVYEGKPQYQEEIRRLQQLNYTEVLRNERESLRNQIKELFRTEIRFRQSGLVRIVFAGLIFIVGAVFSSLARSVYPLITSIVSAVLALSLGMKFEDVLLVKENPVYDPKLLFPEQFEAEFTKLVASDGPLQGKTVVIAIDDIDRCDSPTVRDILVSMKTFMGHQNCFFLVPCDDDAILRVFDEPDHLQGYAQEHLRKYFNVALRIAPLIATDLVDFTKRVSVEAGVPAGVVQMAILADCRDPRKMKHFLNSFIMKYELAKVRQTAGLIPLDMDKNLPGLAKVVVLADLYPTLLPRIAGRQEVYNALESSALGVSDPGDLTQWGLQGWDVAYPGLRDILRRTSNVKIEHLDVLLPLKTSNAQARIPRGFDLANSIVEGKWEICNEIIAQISTEDARAALAALLNDLLQQTTDTFLANTVSATLNLYRKDALLQTDRHQVALNVTQKLSYHSELDVLRLDPSSVFQCATDAGNAFGGHIARKYAGQINVAQYPPDNLLEIITSLYRYTPDRRFLANVLNTKFSGWTPILKSLAILADLRLPDDVAVEEMVPTFQVLAQVCNDVSPEAPEHVQEMNRARRKVLFAHWTELLKVSFAEKLLDMLQRAQADGGALTDSRYPFVIDTLLQKPDCIGEPQSQGLWALLSALYVKAIGDEMKNNIYKLGMVFAVKADNAALAQSANTFVSNNWRQLPDAALRENLQFISTLGGTAPDLRKSLVRQEYATLEQELGSPNQRTSERLNLCYDNTDALDGASGISTLLLQALGLQGPAFDFWFGVTADYLQRLEGNFAKDLAYACIGLVPARPEPTRSALMSLFCTALDRADEVSKPDLVHEYFTLLRSSEATVRDSAANATAQVRDAVSESEFKVRLRNLVHHLCDLRPQETPSYASTFRAVLDHVDLLGETESTELAVLTRRLMEESIQALRDFGLFLVDRLQNVPAEHQEDVVQLLIDLAGPSSPHREAAIRVLEKWRYYDLSAAARRALDSHFATAESRPQ